MSWHGPQNDWDIQYIPTRREARARRFLYPAGTSAEAELSVPAGHHSQGDRMKLCGRALDEGVFGKKASSSCPRARRGAGFTDIHSTQLHPAMSCSWGRAAPLVWESWLLLPCVLHGALGSARVEHPRAQSRCHLWERARGAAQQGLHCPAPPACRKRLGTSC